MITEQASKTFVPTRFYSLSYGEDGALILHSSRTGAIGAVPSHQADFVRGALKRTARHSDPLEGILADLYEGGFLIEEGTDERALVSQSYLAKYSDEYLDLTILPTEECNFRCVYCYESFLRGEMSKEIQEGIRRFVASQHQLKHLSVNWFGGEPLLAANVVIEQTKWFHSFCAERGISFRSGMTTNGSLLFAGVADEIIPHGVRSFQITLDGLPDDHNQRRVLKGGGDTFDAILTNLRYLKQSDHVFLLTLRHNFDPAGLEHLADFVAMLKREFGGDPRFSASFEPIGKWGSANDSELSVCEGQSAVQAFIRGRTLAVEAGFHGGMLLDYMRPNGMTCYAGDPRSFVIGSDGRIYKCTVELDYHDRNVVGRLNEDGTMQLDWRKMALWVETNGRREGTKCSKCFFGPTCHGAVCPKQWMDEEECECPPHKIGIRQLLPLVLKQSEFASPPDLGAFSQCAKA